jgi:hypothetical protein
VVGARWGEECGARVLMRRVVWLADGSDRSYRGGVRRERSRRTPGHARYNTRVSLVAHIHPPRHARCVVCVGVSSCVLRCWGEQGGQTCSCVVCCRAMMESWRGVSLVRCVCVVT